MDWLSLGLGFVIGAIAASIVVSIILGRACERRVVLAESEAQEQIQRAMREAQDADMAHRETKERLIALQLEKVATAAKPVPAAKANDAAAAQKERPSYTRPANNNLKRIRGIGRAVEKRLNGMGITTIEELAALAPDQVKSIEERLGFPGRVDREAWISQAKAMVEAAEQAS